MALHWVIFAFIIIDLKVIQKYLFFIQSVKRHYVVIGLMLIQAECSMDAVDSVNKLRITIFLINY